MLIEPSLPPILAARSSFSYADIPIPNTEEPIGSPRFWWKLAISMCLVLAGGVFAGLTLGILTRSCLWVGEADTASLASGLMGLDEMHLRVLATSSEDL